MTDTRTEVQYLLKYYKLTELNLEELLPIAQEWLDYRDAWGRALRTRLRAWLIEYYQENILERDNPSIGNGLGKWHIQIPDDADRNIYCNKSGAWVSSWHENFTVRDLMDHYKEKGWLEVNALISICQNCIKGYLRGGRGK